MFGKKRVEEPVVVVEKEPDCTLIAEGVTLVGDFETHDYIRIKGTLQGNIISDTKIIIDPAGKIEGNGVAEKMHIEGLAQGEFKCDDCVHLTETGVMTGKLSTFHLTTEDGSIFEGTLSLRKPELNEEPKETSEETNE